MSAETEVPLSGLGGSTRPDGDDDDHTGSCSDSDSRSGTGTHDAASGLGVLADSGDGRAEDSASRQESHVANSTGYELDGDSTRSSSSGKGCSTNSSSSLDAATPSDNDTQSTSTISQVVTPPSTGARRDDAATPAALEGPALAAFQTEVKRQLLDPLVGEEDLPKRERMDYWYEDGFDMRIPPHVICGRWSKPKEWERSVLRLLYSILFLNCAAFAFQHSILWNGPVSPSVTLFNGEEKRPAPLIAADILTVLSSLAMAIALDCMGRGQGLVIAVTSATLGLALFAGSRNVQTLSAGQVFYGVGFTGVRLTADVLVADSTDLRTRALVYAFVSFPWAITAFSAPALRQSLQEQELRHALVAFTCIVPALGMALAVFIWYHQTYFDNPKTLSDLKSELWSRRDHRLGLPGAYVLVLFTLLSLFLLLWLVQLGTLPWYSAVPPVVMFLVVLSVNTFPYALRRFQRRMRIWRRRMETENPGTRTKPPRLLEALWDVACPPVRPVEMPSTKHPLGGLRTTAMYSVCALCIIWKLAHSCWTTNLHPYLQIKFLMSSSAARRLISLSLAVETVCMIPMGLYVRRTARFQRVLLAAVPLYCAGGILFIVAAKSDTFGLLVFSIVLTSMARSTFEAVKEVALLCRARWRRDAAMLLALLSLCEKIGGMIGATLSDILWAKALPNPPARYLNGQTVLSGERVHPLLALQLAYARGSAERNVIVRTYDRTQTAAVAIACVAMVFGFLCVCKMDNVSLLLARETLTHREQWAMRNLRLQAMADAGWGDDLRRSLQDQSRRQDMADALRIDVERYKALGTVQDEVQRLEILNVLEAGKATKGYLEAWKGHDRRAELLKAVEDDDCLRKLLQTLGDDDRHQEYAEALHSYRQRLYLMFIEGLVGLREQCLTMTAGSTSQAPQ